MPVTLPDPKKCPKCNGMMYWVIITTTPGQKLPQFVGYLCRGGSESSPPTVGGCGYKEEYKKPT